MRQSILTLTLTLLAIFSSEVNVAKAQSVQLHYDFGHLMYDQLERRPSLTSTIDYLGRDRWGRTFFFVDMDYQDNGVKSAFFKFERKLRFWSLPLDWHVEYNGGLNNETSYSDAYITGLSYSFGGGNHTWGLTIAPLYKYMARAKYRHTPQLSGAWFLQFAEGRISLSGFFDLWGKDLGGEDPSVAFMSEPQFWINLYNIPAFPSDVKLSIGGEVELSYNRIGQGRFYAIPTIATKWSF
jgi:hypothetical protein